MKKISFLLAILMLVTCLFLVACNSSKNNENTTLAETTPEETTAPDLTPKILATDISKYNLICEARSGNSAIIWDLQSQIQKMCGKKIVLETDYLDETEFEILIGKTNRKESEEFISDLLWDDYGYAIVGSKIVIAGHTAETTQSAMRAFLEHLQSGDHTSVFFSNKDQYIFRYPYVSDTFLLNGIDVSRAKIVVNKKGNEQQMAQLLSDKSLELCGRRPEIVTDETLVLASDPLIIIGASKYVPTQMQSEWDAAQETVDGQFSYYIGNTENIVWIHTEILEGYSALNREIIPQIQSNATANLTLQTGLIKVPQIFSVMSFNVFVSQFNDARVNRVIDTILENTPSVFGVQEASVPWMNAFKSKIGDVYTAIGNGRDGGNNGEHSAIFYRSDKFTLIESGTKWLSAIPDTAGSYYRYTDPETGIIHRANFPRIMTYVILERKNDGARFLYVNTHLDHDGENGREIGEQVRQGQIEILLSEIAKLPDLPTIVTGDFNVTPEATAYTTMIAGGFLDTSHEAKTGEIKSTYNGMSDDYEGAIIDYIFVSPELKGAVDTYTVCPAKRDGQWISDHNAIIATITLPVPEAQE